MAALLTVTGDRRRYSLGARAEIGRSPECDVCISETSISRRHARVVFDGGAYRLQDLQSRFGTFVNGQPAAEAVLRHGDQVQLGNVQLVFEDLGEAPAASPLGAVERDLASARAEVTGSGLNPLRLRELEATISDLERRLAELSRAERTSAALLEVARLSAQSFDPAVLVECVADATVHAMRADRCVLLLLEGGELVPRAARNLGGGLSAAEASAARQAVSDAAVIRASEGPDGRAAYFCAMRGKQGQPLGVLGVAPAPGRTLAADEAELLASLASQVGVSLENVLLLSSVRHEEKLREGLSRFLSDKVVDLVVQGNMQLSLGGEHRNVSVMFVDIRGFTPLAERLAPTDVLSLLNEYFSFTTEAVFAEDGAVDKYIGDALMAVFGAPVASEDHATRAVRAAVEIRRVVGHLRNAWRTGPRAAQLGPSELAIGIGVNTGTAVAGNIGTHRRMEYTVIGDVVNLASRLCSTALPGQILIGPDTRAALGDAFPVRALAPLKVKGKQLPVQAFEVL